MRPTPPVVHVRVRRVRMGWWDWPFLSDALDVLLIVGFLMMASFPFVIFGWAIWDAIA